MSQDSLRNIKKNYKKNDKRGVSHPVKEEWHNIKKNYSSNQGNDWRKEKKHNNVEWYDDECWEAIKRIILRGKQ